MKSGVFTSIRGKTLLYSSAVLSLCTILIGAACCYFFSRSYNAVIERESAAKLTAVSNQFDEYVFRYVKGQFFEITQNYTLFQNLYSFTNDPYYQPPVRILNAVNELRSLVQYSNGRIYSADIYYPASGIVLSSFSGFLDLSNAPVRTDRELWEEIVNDWQGLYRWDLRRISSYQRVSTLCLWPVQNVVSGEIKALAAISIDPNAFSGYLSDLETEDEKYFLISSEAVLFYGDPDQLTAYISTDDLVSIIQGKGQSFAYRNSVHKAVPKSNNVSVSYVYLSEAPVVLFSVVSKKALQQGMNGIIASVGGIVFFVISFGLAASGFFSKKLYTPLGQLVSSVSKLSSNTENRNYENEYALIGTTIENLSYKASEYEKTFNDYLKIMRYGFLQSLYNRQLRDRDEIFSKARFLNLNLEARYFRIMKVNLKRDVTPNVNDDLPAYNILTYMESLGGQKDLNLYGIKNTGMSLSVLCNYGSDENSVFQELIQETSRYCAERFSIGTQTALSSVRENLEDIYLCIGDIEAMEPYFYFCPERSFLRFEDIPALNQHEELPLSIVRDFESALKGGNINTVQSVFEGFRLLCGSLKYSSINCTDLVHQLTQIFLEYLETHRFQSYVDAWLLNSENYGNVEKWREALENACIRIFELVESRNKNQRTTLVSNILAYINANYTSPLISLDSTADYFNISAGWAAKLIKEETGLSFVDYLNKKRFEIAEKLLRDASLKVEEIAVKSGFNSAAYFIKRFRMRFGMTPKEFKRLNRE